MRYIEQGTDINGNEVLTSDRRCKLYKNLRMQIKKL